MNDNDLDDRLKLVGARIRELRKQAGYTSYENFAQAHELDRKHYWRTEKGTNLSLTTLLKILDIHKISLEEFFKGIN